MSLKSYYAWREAAGCFDGSDPVKRYYQMGFTESTYRARFPEERFVPLPHRLPMEVAEKPKKPEHIPKQWRSIARGVQKEMEKWEGEELRILYSTWMVQKRIEGNTPTLRNGYDFLKDFETPSGLAEAIAEAFKNVDRE